jgi:hypothetical protein
MIWKSDKGGAPLQRLSPTAYALPRTIRDYPLVHKEASEFTLGYTEHGMRGGPTLLSEAAFRYGIVLTDSMGKGAFRGNLEYTVDWLPAIVLTKPKVVYGAGAAPHSVCDGLPGHLRLHPYGKLVMGGVLSTGNIPPRDTPRPSTRVTSFVLVDGCRLFLAWLVCPLTTHH